MAEYIAHSKGKWKKHKYIRKEGNRYIYPEDLLNTAKKGLKNGAQTVGKGAKKIGSGVYNAAGGKYKKEANAYAKEVRRRTKAAKRYDRKAQAYSKASKRSERRSEAYSKAAERDSANSTEKFDRANENERRSQFHDTLSRDTFDKPVMRSEQRRRSAERLRKSSERLKKSYVDNINKAEKEFDRAGDYSVKSMKNKQKAVKSRSKVDWYNTLSKAANNKYRRSIAGKYDRGKKWLKSKRRRRRK